MEVRYILITLCFIVGTALGSDEMFQAQAKCIQEAKLTGAEYNEAMRTRPLKTENRKIKCFFGCLLESLDWMDKDGNIRPRPGHKIPEDEIEEALPCLKVNGTDKCEKGFNFYKCDIDERMKHGH